MRGRRGSTAIVIVVAGVVALVALGLYLYLEPAKKPGPLLKSPLVPCPGYSAHRAGRPDVSPM